ncbi:ATP-binding protein [Candidatus Gracilibacteria bacterium]|nr:ATP-binding protein [Candidatus Gracilibacteria bacterium]
MSAGEQKVFLLLETIFKADEYSLILIDEIDLLLHNIALENLIKIISERAKKKNLQIVFTTDRESLIELSDFLNIRHIVNKIDKINQTEKTFCFNETKPDAIHRLTGKQEREIEIFVEDDLAVAIIEKIASDLKIKKYVDIKKFGAASNCFTTIAGLLISGENCQNKLFFLDGDVHNTDEEKQKQIKKKLTGNGQQIEDLQNQAFQQITQFNLPEKTKPEEYLHKLLVQINNLESEIIEVAHSINTVDNSHKYISDIINRLNYDKSVGPTKIIDIISTLPEWQNYVSDILNWLKKRVSQVREDTLGVIED